MSRNILTHSVWFKTLLSEDHLYFIYSFHDLFASALVRFLIYSFAQKPLHLQIHSLTDLCNYIYMSSCPASLIHGHMAIFGAIFYYFIHLCLKFRNASLTQTHSFKLLLARTLQFFTFLHILLYNVTWKLNIELAWAHIYLI